MAYKMKYMDEAAIKEIDKLMDDGHEKAITAFAFECGNAGMEGYRIGILKSVAKGAIAAVVVVGGIEIGTRIVRKVRAKKLAKKQTKEKTKV